MYEVRRFAGEIYALGGLGFVWEKLVAQTGVYYGMHSASPHPHQPPAHPVTSFWRIAKKNFKALNRGEIEIKSN